MNVSNDSTTTETPAESRALRASIDYSCRRPVIHFLSSAIAWLLLGTLLAMGASIKLHNPSFLGDTEWLTFGRVRPAHLTTMAYGWSTMACVAVGLWIMARLCRAPIRNEKWLHLSAILLNLGNIVGTIGILAGRSTSIEWLEYPREAGLLIAAGFIPLMFTFADMGRRRKPGHIYVSQWYLMAAIFWFPMLYLTTQVLLIWNPVAAPAQAAMNWWYAHNTLGLWFTPVCLAAAYYLIPKVVGRPVHSYYLSLLGFWSLAFFYAWNGMHHLVGGPYPAWLIGISIAASYMMVIPVIAVAVNHHFTAFREIHLVKSSPTLRFIVFATLSYTAVSLQGTSMAFRDLNRITHFTHYTIGHSHLGMYAFVTMLLFGACYYMMPRLTGKEWPSVWLIRIHFWFCAVGVLYYVLAVSIGGVKQGLWLLNDDVLFMDIVRWVTPYLQHRSAAGIMMSIGHIAFLFSFLGLLLRKKQVHSEPTLLAPAPTPASTPEPAVASV